MELKQQEPIHPLLVRTLGREPTPEEIQAWNKLAASSEQKAGAPGFSSLVTKSGVTAVTYVARGTERLQ
jgi:hypothetical protein